jgi:alkaline phosphatase
MQYCTKFTKILKMKQLLFCTLVVIMYSCKSTSMLEQQKKPTNIILMIGDGMGLTQVSAGLYSNNNHLNFERFLNIGFHKSYSYDDLITDSAAGATAFSCGKKTYNMAVAVDKDSLPIETIMETAMKKGVKTGVVVACIIQHATPACFIAHDKSRKNYENISSSILKNKIDIMIGGGKSYFDKRSDSISLLPKFVENGYYLSDYFKEDISKIQEREKPIMYFTAEKDPLKASEGRDYLAPASVFATNYLSNKSKNGFLLMIEGSQIDWGGHDNDSKYIITEVLDFDKTIGKILDFAEKDKNTLVIVTADHETGGYSINVGSKMNELVTAFTSKSHTGTLIPVYAYGPGSELFRGIYENTAIYDKIKKLMGL